MCLAKICTFDCGHSRLTPEACKYTLGQQIPGSDEDSEAEDDLSEYYRQLPKHHPKRALVVQIEDPKGSNCLCQMGLEMKAESTSDSGFALAVYTKTNLDEHLSEYFYYEIVRPVMKWLENKSPNQTETDITVSTDARKTVPESSLNGSQKLYVTAGVSYASKKCEHWSGDLNKPIEMSRIPQRCPKALCHGRLETIHGVITQDMLSTAPAGINFENLDTWDIEIR